MKKTLLFLVAALMSATLLSAQVTVTHSGYCGTTANGADGKNLTWQLTSDGVLTISGTGEMMDYEFTYEGYDEKTKAPWGKLRFSTAVINEGVTSIGESAFTGCTGLKSVTISQGVTSIGYYAFTGCTGLSSVTIPEGVTSTGYDSFRNCTGLTSVTIPEGVTSIESSSFDGCKGLTFITIPESVTYIGSSAFYKTSLKSLVIPNKVDTIEEHAFYGCDSLRSITFGSGVKYIGHESFSCFNLDTLICKFNNDVKFEYETFAGKTTHPFANTSNIKYISAPVKIFNTVEEAHQTQFSNKLTEVHVTEGELDENGFRFINRSQNTLRIIDLGNTQNTIISDKAFNGCFKLESLTLPSNLEYIGFQSVANCYQLKSVNIPASVVEINDAAFENCRSIKSITFGNQTPQAAGERQMAPADGIALSRIGNWAFYNCHALENLTLPEGVTEVGDAAFYGCTYLQDLVLPSTTQRIGDNCFALCSRMKSITSRSTTPPHIEAKTFFDVNRTIPLIVPEGTTADYAGDIYWKEFMNTKEEDNTQTAVENADAYEVTVFSDGINLHIDGITTDYRIFNAAGALVYEGRETSVTLPRGIYILKGEDWSRKVAM